MGVLTLIKRFIYLLYIILSSISFIICFFNQNSVPKGYEYVSLLPLVFLFGFSVFLVPILNQKKFLLTIHAFVALSFVRMVMIPLISVLSGYFRTADYGSFTAESLEIAVWLMIYEYIIAIIFILLLIRTKKTNKLQLDSLNSKIHLMGNKSVYVGFILFGLIVYLLWGLPEGLIKFVAISSDTDQRFGDETSTFYTLITQIIKITLVCVFLLAIAYFYKRYKHRFKNVYVNLAILFAMLNVSLIVGERRTMLLYTGISSIIVLLVAFPENKRKVLTILGGTALALLLMMSVYKHFYAFNFGSYSAAIKDSDISLSYISQMLHAYFGGPQNTSWIIDMKNLYGTDFFNLIFDIMRSTFGLSFLMKGSGTLTSVEFNNFVYGADTQSGHLITTIGYGYYYFGFVLAPIFTCINLWISKTLENLLNRSTSFEELYLWSYLLSRLLTFMFFNPPSIVSFLTINFATMGLVFLMARLLNYRRI